jgi:hypothetical protein
VEQPWLKCLLFVDLWRVQERKSKSCGPDHGSPQSPMFGLASQHIDGTCGLIILRVRVKKERTSKGISNPSARFILMCAQGPFCSQWPPNADMRLVQVRTLAVNRPRNDSTCVCRRDLPQGYYNFGALVAETILASVQSVSAQTGGHMDASDLIKALQNHLARRGTVHIS